MCMNLLIFLGLFVSLNQPQPSHKCSIQATNVLHYSCGSAATGLYEERISSTCEVTVNYFAFYNRYGEELYTVKNVSLNAVNRYLDDVAELRIELPAATYYYVMDYTFASGEDGQLQGSMTLIY